MEVIEKPVGIWFNSVAWLCGKFVDIGELYARNMSKAATVALVGGIIAQKAISHIQQNYE